MVKRFRKVVEWTWKKPNWLKFFTCMGILGYLYLLFLFIGVKIINEPVPIIVIYLFFIFIHISLIWFYLIYGKYPYKRKVYWEEIK